jgi:hypothetical protein
MKMIGVVKDDPGSSEFQLPKPHRPHWGAKEGSVIPLSPWGSGPELGASGDQQHYNSVNSFFSSAPRGCRKAGAGSPRSGMRRRQQEQKWRNSVQWLNGGTI